MNFVGNRSSVFACALLMCPFVFDWGAKPGVIEDSGRFVKKDVFVPGVPSTVLGMTSVANGNRVASGIAVMGADGVVFLSSKDYSPVSTCRFERSAIGREKIGSNPLLIPVGTDSFEIMRGGGGFSKVGLLDALGRLLWSFDPGRSVPHKMIAAALDGDGAVRFYVAAHAGLYQLDHSGRVLRKFSDDPTDDIGVVQRSGDSRPLLIAIHSPRNEYRFRIFNGEGTVVKEFVPEYKRDRFEVVDWPDRPHLLMGYRCRNVILLDLEGKIAFQHKLRDFPLYHDPQGAVVRFRKAGKPYIVVSAKSRGGTRLSQLSIFSPEGGLVYQEVLDDWIKLCVNRDKNATEEVLLVGARNRIFEYSLGSPKHL
jgi:hypothetical protein